MQSNRNKIFDLTEQITLPCGQDKGEVCTCCGLLILITCVCRSNEHPEHFEICKKKPKTKPKLATSWGKPVVSMPYWGDLNEDHNDRPLLYGGGESNSSSESSNLRFLASASNIKCQRPGTDNPARHFLNASSDTSSSPESSRNFVQKSILLFREFNSLLSMRNSVWNLIPFYKFLDTAINRVMEMKDKHNYQLLYKMRTRNARIALGRTQQEMSQILEVELDTYKKWERGATGMMPQMYVLKFCLITGISVEEFVSAKASPKELADLKVAENTKVNSPD